MSASSHNDALALLTYPKVGIQNVNLNNYTTTGVYRLNGNITNSASGNYGVLIVFGLSATVVRQLQFAEANANMYTRVNYNGTWTAWHRVDIIAS